MNYFLWVNLGTWKNNRVDIELKPGENRIIQNLTWCHAHINISSGDNYNNCAK